MTNHEQMIISALRYAIPRRSYIMSSTEDYIMEMLKGSKVSKAFIDIAIKDIEEHYKYNERMKVEDSMQHDWRPLLHTLQTQQTNNIGIK